MLSVKIQGTDPNRVLFLKQEYEQAFDLAARPAVGEVACFQQVGPWNAAHETDTATAGWFICGDAYRVAGICDLVALVLGIAACENLTGLVIPLTSDLPPRCDNLAGRERCHAPQKPSTQRSAWNQ